MPALQGEIKSASKAVHTRMRLMDAALEIFGRYSYEGATTRMLAQQAGVNTAAIPYHFGSKEGLYCAVVQSGVNTFQEQLSPLLAEFRDKAQNTRPSQEASIALLLALMTDLLELLATANARHRLLDWGFAQNSKMAHRLIDEGVVTPIYQPVADLVSQILILPEDRAEVTLKTHAILGQLLACCLAREVILRRLRRERFSPIEQGLMQTMLQGSIRAILDSRISVEEPIR